MTGVSEPRIAIHEAGHAVVARACGLGVRDVSIIPSAGYLGRVLHDPRGHAVPMRRGAANPRGPTAVGKELMLAHLFTSLAGMAAEAVWQNTEIFAFWERNPPGSSGGQTDFEHAQIYAHCLFDNLQLERQLAVQIVFAAAQFTEAICAFFWPAIDAVARELLLHKRLIATQLDHSLQATIPSGWRSPTCVFDRDQLVDKAIRLFPHVA